MIKNLFFILFLLSPFFASSQILYLEKLRVSKEIRLDTVDINNIVTEGDSINGGANNKLATLKAIKEFFFANVETDTLLQDSILVQFINGIEIRRDTIRTLGGAGGGGTLTGSGTANQIAFWDGTTSLTGASSFVIDDGTNKTIKVQNGANNVSHIVGSNWSYSNWSFGGSSALMFMADNTYPLAYARDRFNFQPVGNTEGVNFTNAAGASALYVDTDNLRIAVGTDDTSAGYGIQVSNSNGFGYIHTNSTHGTNFRFYTGSIATIFSANGVQNFYLYNSAPDGALVVQDSGVKTSTGYFGSTGTDAFLRGGINSGDDGYKAGLQARDDGLGTWYDVIYTENTDTGYPNAFLVPSGGNVGIGTTSPNQQVHIENGTANGHGVVRGLKVENTSAFNTIMLSLESSTGTGSSTLGWTFEGTVKATMGRDPSGYLGMSVEGSADNLLRIYESDRSLRFYDGTNWPGSQVFNLSKEGNLDTYGTARIRTVSDSTAAYVVTMDSDGNVYRDTSTNYVGGASLRYDNDQLPYVNDYWISWGLDASGTAGSARYDYNVVDSMYYRYTNGSFNSEGTDGGGWAVVGTSGDSIQIQAPFGVVIGDSQAEGHPALHGRLHPNGVAEFQYDYPDSTGQLSYHLRELTNMRWYNHGIGSERSDATLERFNRDVLGATSDPSDGRGSKTLSRKADYVVIIIGINDFFGGSPLTADETKANLEEMASRCAANNIGCIILDLPGDTGISVEQSNKVDEVNRWLHSGALNQYGATIIRYNEWWKDPDANDNSSKNSNRIIDSIHPSAAGYDTLATYIFDKAKLPVLDSILLYMEVDDFTGYSRPDSVKINGTPYGISGSTARVPLTAPITSDSIWIKVESSTNVTGTTYTGFSHIEWHLGNDGDDLVTRRSFPFSSGGGGGSTIWSKSGTNISSVTTTDEVSIGKGSQYGAFSQLTVKTQHNDNSQGVVFQNSDDNIIMAMDNNIQVGIGGIPVYTLDVYGAANFRNGSTYTFISGSTYQIWGSTPTIGLQSTNVGPYRQMNITWDAGALQFRPRLDANGSDFITQWLDKNGETDFIIRQTDDEDKVGINTATVTATLDVDTSGTDEILRLRYLVDSFEDYVLTADANGYIHRTSKSSILDNAVSIPNSWPNTAFYLNSANALVFQQTSGEPMYNISNTNGGSVVWGNNYWNGYGDDFYIMTSSSAYDTTTTNNNFYYGIYGAGSNKGGAYEEALSTPVDSAYTLRNITGNAYWRYTTNDQDFPQSTNINFGFGLDSNTGEDSTALYFTGVNNYAFLRYNTLDTLTAALEVANGAYSLAPSIFTIANNGEGDDIHITTTGTNSGIQIDATTANWGLRTWSGQDFVIRDATNLINVITLEDNQPGPAITIAADGDIRFHEYDSGRAYNSSALIQGKAILDNVGQLQVVPSSKWQFRSSSGTLTAQDWIVQLTGDATLPSPATSTSGKVWILKADGSASGGSPYTVDVSGCSSNCIDSDADLTFDNANEVWIVIDTGSSYYKVHNQEF